MALVCNSSTGCILGRPLLRRVAERVCNAYCASIIWRRIEIIGDVAIIRRPFDADIPTDIFKAIGEELLKELPYVKSVWLAVTPIHGVERVRELVHLAGEKRSETTYREHGCIFKLDVLKVYVSPVLSYDHLRVAKQVRENEKILNMFAGFCPYSIVISKHARPRYVISIDINEHAARYARINTELNKVAHINEVIHGDSLIITPALNETFDRILMPYPDLFEDAIAVAAAAIKSGGHLHPHLFIDADSKKEALAMAVEVVVSKLNRLGLAAKVVGGHVIRGVAPRRYHVTVDVCVNRA